MSRVNHLGDAAVYYRGPRSGFQHVGTFPPPICAVCGRQVDRMDCSLPQGQAAAVFTVRCHGQVEEVTMTFKQIIEAKGQFKQGRAFEATVGPLEG